MQIREKMILFPKINNYCKTIIINRGSAKLFYVRAKRVHK